MSGKLHTPLFTPAQAAALLDQVICEQVLECIDLDALHRPEQSISRGWSSKWPDTGRACPNPGRGASWLGHRPRSNAPGINPGWEARRD
jgi:hypothetical protein